MIRKTRTALAFFAATALAFVTGLAGADEVMHGRVSFTDQSALVKGSDDADWSYAGVNSLIMPGDTVWADEQSALEIEFSGGTFLRLADGSKLDVVETPPSALFIGATGSFYVQRVRRSPGDVTFDTPVGAIEVAPDSQVRFDILEEGATTVTVRWGTATINAEGGAPVTLGTGERSFIDPGFLPSAPVVFDRTQEDEFDTWSRTRARNLAEGSTGTPIQSSYSNGTPPMGVSDLNGYGEWITEDNTSYWRPYDTDYVPYRYGSWSYVPAQGYTWVDYYPWAYCTSHYGYWNYRPRYGWCWSYAGYYRPAYAYTLHYGDRFIWAPLSVYGYPVCYDSYASFYIGGIGFSYGFSSYCHDYYVWGGGYHNVWVVDYDCIYDRHNNHRYNNCDYWRIDTDKRPYKNGGQPHWPGDRQDTFAPDRVYRGAPTKPDGTMRARDRAQTLEARVPSRTNQGGPAIRTARNNQTRPTSPALANGGRTRDVRLADPSATRLARGSDLVRRPAEPGAVDNSGRSFTNDDARGARPLSRGSNPQGTVSRPSPVRGESAVPSDRGPSTSPRPTRPNTEGATQERPTTSRPTTARPSQPRPQSGEPVFGGVEDSPAERPRPTNTRPSQPRPQSGEPVFGGVEDSPAQRPRPTTTRPMQQRPQSSQPVFGSVEDYPTRPQQQVARPQQERPVYNQPIARPQAEIVRPQQQQQQRYPQYEQRPQSQVSRPQQQQPVYERPQSQVNGPEPQRQQQFSRPEPQYSPPPQRSEPSRQSAPSYSDRGSFSGGGGSGGGSFSNGGGGGGAPSRSSGGGGPSRSRGN